MNAFILSIIVLLSGTTYGQLDNETEVIYRPEIRTLNSTIVGSEMIVELEVYTFNDFYNYPAVVAFLNGEQLNEPQLEYYAQGKNSMLKYQLSLPKKYSNQLDQIQFKLTGANNGEWQDLKRKEDRDQDASNSKEKRVKHDQDKLCRPVFKS